MLGPGLGLEALVLALILGYELFMLEHIEQMLQ